MAQSLNQGNMQYDPLLRGQAMGGAPQYMNAATPAMHFHSQQSQYHQAQAGQQVFNEEAAFARAFDEAESWQSPSADGELKLDQQADPQVFDEEAAFARAFEEAESWKGPSADSELEHQAEQEVLDEEAAARAYAQRPAPDWELELDQAVRDYERENAEKAFAELRKAIDAAAAEDARRSQSDPIYVTQRLGADLIVNPITDLQAEQRTPRSPDQDNDALARTAGYLLDSVSTNTDPKFQNSQFLKLMQQFRDREAIVEGDKIVGTGMDAGGALDKKEKEKEKQVAAEAWVVSPYETQLNSPHKIAHTCHLIVIYRPPCDK